MSSSSREEEIWTTSKRNKKLKRNRAFYLTKTREPKKNTSYLSKFVEDVVFKFRDLIIDADPEIRATSEFPLNKTNDQKSSLQESEEKKMLKSTLQISENSGILASQILSDVGNEPGCSKEGTTCDVKQHSDFVNYRPIADNYFESDEHTSSISISDMESPRTFKIREKKYLNPEEVKQRTNKWYHKHAQYLQRLREGQETKMNENEVEVEDWNRFRVMRRISDSSEHTSVRRRSSERSPNKRYTIKYTRGYYRSHFPTNVMRNRTRRLNKTKNERSNSAGEVVVGITEDKGNVTSSSARTNIPFNELKPIPEYSSERVIELPEMPVASQEQRSSIIESVKLRQFTELRPFISPMSTTESSDNSRSPERRRGAHAHAHVDDEEIIMESDNNNNRIVENPANDSMLIDD